MCFPLILHFLSWKGCFQWDLWSMKVLLLLVSIHVKILCFVFFLLPFVPCSMTRLIFPLLGLFWFVHDMGYDLLFFSTRWRSCTFVSLACCLNRWRSRQMLIRVLSSMQLINYRDINILSFLLLDLCWDLSNLNLFILLRRIKTSEFSKLKPWYSKSVDLFIYFYLERIYLNSKD